MILNRAPFLCDAHGAIELSTYLKHKVGSVLRFNLITGQAPTPACEGVHAQIPVNDSGEKLV
jgi:hypothetical protein